MCKHCKVTDHGILVWLICPKVQDYGLMRYINLVKSFHVYSSLFVVCMASCIASGHNWTLKHQYWNKCCVYLAECLSNSCQLIQVERRCHGKQKCSIGPDVYAREACVRPQYLNIIYICGENFQHRVYTPWFIRFMDPESLNSNRKETDLFVCQELNKTI